MSITYDARKLSGSCPSTDEEVAHQHFLKTFLENEGAPKDTMVGRYLEWSPEDVELKGYEQWLRDEFSGYYEAWLEDQEEQRTEARLGA